MGFGTGELILIVVLVLLFFGATRLPAVGEGLGKAVRSLKSAFASERPNDPQRPPDPPRPPDRGASR